MNMKQLKQYVLLILFIVCISIGLISCSGQIKHEEYLIYSAIIDSLAKIYPNNLTAFVYDSTLESHSRKEYFNKDSLRILHYTDPGIGSSAPSFSEDVMKNWPNLNMEFLERDFKAKNYKPYLIKLDYLHADLPIHRWNPDSTSSMLVREGNALLFWFSRPAINQSEDEAIVYSEYLCASLCGAGKWFWLKKSDGSWKIYKSLETWVS